ncbi:MAG: YcxB family protein [Lachnospiraceae bacterium]|jgi:hypothetical protein|nr:YcxB family protein [Lachnospiraceae bacterium]
MDIKVQLTSKDFLTFQMYHAYHRVQTWVFTILGAAITVLAFTMFNKVEITYSLIYLACGLFFVGYTPLHLRNRAKMAFRGDSPLTKAMTYHFDEQGVTVHFVDPQAETEEESEVESSVTWEQVYRVRVTKEAVYLYTSPRNASILPLEQIGDKQNALKELFQKELKGHQYDHRN